MASIMSDPRIDRVSVASYTIPTDGPESDGTLAWNSTTLVLVRLSVGRTTGIGYTYADKATAAFIAEQFGPLLRGTSPLAISACWQIMKYAVRNLGRGGVASMAMSAVDIALWDLKARLLGLPLVDLLGQVHTQIPVYGSGGFTSYSVSRLEQQLANWAASGMGMVKMKVGREPNKDLDRVRAARRSIGRKVQLFVDANGAFAPVQALAFAEVFSPYGVTWFEEPIPATDIYGLQSLRERLPPGMQLAAGEYDYQLSDCLALLNAHAVNVLQVDATRSEGVTGFMQAATLAAAASTPISSHTAPAIHAHLCCCIEHALHVEYFYDHVRIEQLLFDGALEAAQGALRPDRSRPGLGLELREQAAGRYVNEEIKL